MNTKKQNSGSNAKFYVVLPTLEIMLSASKNCKLRAGYANMEYSNFMKHCKMQTVEDLSSILCSYCTNWGRTLNFQTDDNPRRATIQS